MAILGEGRPARHTVVLQGHGRPGRLPPMTRLDMRKLSPRRVRTEAALGVVFAALVVLLGPRVEVDETVEDVTVPADVDAWLAEREARFADLRPGEQKEVVWMDSTGARTPLSLVYIHGFSADRHEIAPVPERIADALGANLFYTRLTGHGRSEEAMGEATAQAWFQDVAEAVAVGERIGERVVLMGTSTGATLAVWAAAHEELRSRIAALILISPNFAPQDGRSRMLLWPWGASLAKAVQGPRHCWEARSEAHAAHWNTCYPVEALLPLMGVVERARTLDVGEIQAPTLVFYTPDDRVVDQRLTEARFPLWGSEMKRLTTVAGADDAMQHVLAGDIMSPSTSDTVVAEVVAFLEEAALR